MEVGVELGAGTVDTTGGAKHSFMRLATVAS